MLNKDQEKAVTSTAKATLVVAGPGSGKTRVIVHRLIHLIKKGVKPEKILALTFSRQAALEMKSRVAKAIPEAFSSLWVDTFHAFSAEILRQWGEDIGLNPFFEIATYEDSLAILAGLVAEQEFADFFIDLEAVLNFISRAKDEAVLANEYADYARYLKEEQKQQKLSTNQLALIYQAYQKELARQGLLDFGDLLLKAIELLKNSSKAQQYRQRFDHILVDEFQDTNYAQGELLKLLKGENTSLFVVGDDDQSIYRFRGASLKNILDFQKTFNPTYKVTLNQNYRSGSEIINASQTLIKNNAQRLEKKIKPALNIKDSVSIIQTETKEAQVDFVIEQIQQLRAEHGWKFKDFALLFSSLRHEAGPFIEKFNQLQIPFAASKFDNLMSSPVIRELMAWLKLITNPFSWSSLASILITFYNLEAEEVAHLNQQRLYKETAIELIKRVTNNSKAAKQKEDKRLKNFLKTYTNLVKLSRRLAVDKFIAQLVKQLQLVTKAAIYSLEEFKQRQIEINYFLTLANRFSCYQAQSSLEDFLNYLKRMSQITVVESPPEGEDKIHLLTLHAAKGLEFKAVFILNLTKTKMPGRRVPVLYDLPDSLLKEKFSCLDASEQHKSEKRRLLYVGLTRAKEKLFLLYPQEENKPAQRSPFLDELLELPSLQVKEYKIQKQSDSFKLLPFWPQINAVSAPESLLEALLEDVARLMKIYQANFWLHNQADCHEQLNKIKQSLFKPEWQEKLTVLPLNLQQQQTVAKAHSAVLQEKQLSLTVSDLTVYLKCPNQFKFKVIYKIPPLASAAANFGVLIHRVLQKFHQHSLSKPTSEDVLLNLYDQALATLPALYYPSETEVEFYREALKNYFKNFVKQEGECVLIEHPFDLAVNGHLISGRIDRVDKLKDGQYELIDYKTGSPKKKNEIKKEIQLAIYALGAIKNWQIQPAYLTYYFIKSGEKISLKPTEFDLEATELLIAQTIERIVAGEFSPTEDYFHCKYCEYDLICELKQRQLR